MNHLHLHVPDLAAERRFYEEWFGFREDRRYGDVVFLRDPGGFDLALVEDAEPAELPGWLHLGFRLPERAAVRGLYGRMQDAGVRLTSDYEEYDDYVTYRCADPAEVTLEVYWEAELNPAPRG